MKNLQISCTPALLGRLERHGRGFGEAVATARRDLGAYYTYLAVGMRGLPGKFTGPEIEALIVITQGHDPRPGITAREELEQYWDSARRLASPGQWGDVNEAALSVKISSLPYEVAEAVIELCRMWHAMPSHTDGGTARMFRCV